MSPKFTRSLVENIEILTLSNESVEISVAPAFGGRVVSIVDRKTGREWLDGWSPPAVRRLWTPVDPADFATGPGAGLDECLPTVLPCEVGGRQLGDHGELWNRPVAVEVDESRLALRCRWSLESLPLGFEREIVLGEGRLTFSYRIENLAAVPTPYQWAWHPLFAYEPGDELRFEPTPTVCFEPQGPALPWPVIQPGCNLSTADLAGIASQCAKVFVGPLAAGHARIQSRDGARMDIEWPVEWLPYAGIWITRGGWKGLHHWAVEPTNVPLDRLADALLEPEFRRLAVLEAQEARTWEVTLGFSSNRQ